jgi:DNA-binding CsgD family transcriptional regulator
MLTSFFLKHADQCGEHLERREDGVAFLKALQSLYEVADLSYLCLNLPKAAEARFLHCHYSGAGIVQKTSLTRIDTAGLAELGLLAAAAVDWRTSERLAIELDLRTFSAKTPQAQAQGASFALQPSFGETALLGFAVRCGQGAWERRKAILLQDLGALGQYFHSHMLRLNGHDSSKEMLVSARELECLKWTAEGKTAQEASAILGISERTVRFHLNAAREKMHCVNTTQAVAQAIAKNLIKISGV